VLLHGAGQSSQSFLTLARAMADQFTLYVPDRRGRDMSGPYSKDHGLDNEVGDVEALLACRALELVRVHRMKVFAKDSEPRALTPRRSTAVGPRRGGPDNDQSEHRPSRLSRSRARRTR
jgi:hypothetical protein